MDFEEILNIIKAFLNAILDVFKSIGIKFGGNKDDDKKDDENTEA